MPLQHENADPDWPIHVNIRERRGAGTYLPGGDESDELRVRVNGDGTLGTGGQALVVSPGTGQVNGTELTIKSGDDRTLDVDRSGSNDRRDVVYLSDAGTLEVRKGRPGSFAWEGVAQSARTYRNAYRPPPPDLRSTPGLVLAIVTIQSGSPTISKSAIDDSVRVGASTATGISGQPIQSGVDGRIVPVAPGIGTLDAIDPAATNTPVQDAIDAVNAVGSGDGSGPVPAGAIYYPPGTIKTPGGISESGGIRHNGAGIASTRIQLTDMGADLFTFTSNQEGGHAYWTGMMLSGGDRASRTGGSAFHFINGSHTEFNFGRMAFEEWGTDPIIHFDGDGPYGSTWQNVLAGSYTHDGPVLRVENTHTFGLQIGLIGCGCNDPMTPAVEISDADFGGYIGVINQGGNSGKILHHDTGGSFADNDSRGDSLDVGWINSEPNNKESAPWIVKLDGDTPVRIRHITKQQDLTVTTAPVVLDSSGQSGAGPGRNRIGTINPTGYSGDNIIVQAAAEAPSYYWGPRSDIGYNGHDPIAVIPMANRGQPAPANLSGVTGNYDGEVRSDDGTNSPGRGVVCVWDATNSVWRRPDGTSFT